ncbi:MAG: aldehyde dehydrogenase family protein [Trebonia sp.]
MTEAGVPDGVFNIVHGIGEEAGAASSPTRDAVRHRGRGDHARERDPLRARRLRDLRTPFGGVKASGLGREGGQHSIDFYTESRIVHVALGDTHVPRFGA